MKVALLTREYPPEVYGGAGVHVEYLARELRALEDVSVHAWGEDREGATGHRAWDALAGDAPHLAALRCQARPAQHESRRPPLIGRSLLEDRRQGGMDLAGGQAQLAQTVQDLVLDLLVLGEGEEGQQDSDRLRRRALDQ